MSKAKSLYFSLLQIPLIYLYSATLVITTLVVAAWWLLVYQPTSASLLRMQNELNQTHATIIDLKKSQRELEQVTARHGHLEARLKEYASKKSNANESLMLAEITDAALGQGLLVQGCRINADTITIDLRGSLDALIIFFESFERNKQMVACVRTDITKSSADVYGLQALFKLVPIK